MVNTLTKFSPSNFVSRANSIASELDRFIPTSLMFDSFFKDLDDVFSVPKGSLTSINYPPCNVVKTSENEYQIHLAVAGFKRDEITVVANNEYLKITGKKLAEVSSDSEEKDDNYPQYFFRGIAGREFLNKFQLSPNTYVKEVTLEDGILNVKLKREIPEEVKEKTYQIK